MLNNNFELLEELLSPGGSARELDSRPEDYHPREARAGGGALFPGGAGAGPAASAGCTDQVDLAFRQSRVDSLLWAYRDVGWLYADLNPLGEAYSEKFTALNEVKEKSYHSLGLAEFGLCDSDLAVDFLVGGGIHGTMPLGDILEVFRRTYCGPVGVEFLHIQNKEMREWLIARLEGPAAARPLDEAQRRTILEDLVKAEELERFLQATFLGQKRFSIEGSEAVIPALHALLDGAGPRGIERIEMGATHRGRLTILALIVGKPLEELFYLFEQGFTPGTLGGHDDVKYHIGYASTHVHEDGSRVEIALSPNASHLESVGPIVVGRARGRQDRIGDPGGKRVLPVILHGDAALAGQGVVAETFNMSQLEGYCAGGTIHVVINNQIGFTTPSRNAHSGLNPTDIAKMNPVPIFHVNGDRPEAVVRVMRMALDFRQAFGSDVVVDIFCYRRQGHNEGDEPSFTHPYMYDLIRAHPSAAALYGEDCVASGLLGPDAVAKLRSDYAASLEAALLAERAASPSPAPGAAAPREAPDTRLDAAALSRIVEGLSAVPEGMQIHEKLKSIAAGKLKSFREKGLLDWASAEAAAFGSLLLEGVQVRLSGEDSERGTFSQRHLVWWETGAAKGAFHVPLNHLGPGQRAMDLSDSPLSEFGVMGFEYGYAAEYPEALVMWEAQYGDFCNGGQVIIDNYLIAAEAKWGAANGLVLLLPHGYEGNGPEHSNAHLERFLGLCAEDNIRVACPSTPAQYFHLLRAQAKDKAKKPLVVMTPKSLLRLPAALSRAEDFAASGFQAVLDDPSAAGAESALLFCAGKLWYELAARKKESGRKDIAIIRIERLHPFPEAELRALLAKYPAAKRLTWTQEEPKNRGAWQYMRERFESSFPSHGLGYAGRKASASPATGSHERHAAEQAELIASAFREGEGRAP